MKRDRILVTGANGFVGHHLCAHLASSGRNVTACIRPTAAMPAFPLLDKIRLSHVADYSGYNDWPELLTDVDTVIHLAARVHVMRDGAPDSLAEFRRINVAATEAIARKAGSCGVRRFIYVSSIKVNGEATSNREFRADDAPGYVDPYGQSKWEAEQRLETVAAISGLEWVIVRPTLVYGPGVRGNFLSLMRYVHRRLPLPFGAVRNRRSIVSVYNLVDLLAKAIDHPAAAGQRFLVKDPEDVSTGELVRRIAVAMQQTPLLLNVPTAALLWAGKLLRQKSVAQRLLDSLVVNTEKTTERLQWKAPVSLDDALAPTCSWFKDNFAVKGA